MSKILSNIGTVIGKPLGKAYDYTVTRKWCAKTLNTAVKNPEKYAVAMVIASIVSKDLVGCYYYTTQSLRNKRIPEEKRKFVASVDLMNGIIMVFGQILAGIGFEKILNKFVFKKCIDKKLDDDILKVHAKKLVEKAKTLGNDVTLESVHKELLKQYGSDSTKYKAMKSGLGLMIAFFATTALTKRVLAPLFSTPLAGWYKGKYMDKKVKNERPEDVVYVEPLANKLPYSWATLNRNNDKNAKKFNSFLK